MSRMDKVPLTPRWLGLGHAGCASEANEAMTAGQV
jgi:hypothetical protein